MAIQIAQIVRSGFVEGHHYGSAVVLDPHGNVQWSVGDISSQIFPRSANKLMQGLAMVRAGLPLTDHHLALACASHSGEDIHLDGVRDILNAANLDVDALGCPADWPLDAVERDSVIVQGGEMLPIYMNCSGKHAAKLFTCVLNGWDTQTYLNFAHPLQQLIKSTMEECTGELVEHIGVDGCGAPLLSTSLIGLARSFGTFSGPNADPNQQKIATAIKDHPEYLSGTRRPDFHLIKSVAGMVSKIGAEAVYGIGLADGSAIALKIDDGGERAAGVVAAAILENVLGISNETISQQRSVTLFGGGHPVGAITSMV
jgi:L-asparaginase II